MVQQAFQNNLDVKAAAYRVIQARYNRYATAGTLFPQTQTYSGSFTRSLRSANGSGLGGIPGIPRYNNSFDTGFNLNWELDFWGRIRRSMLAADANYEASVEDLDDVLVTLVADVASAYIEIRAIDRRLEFARQNVEIQSKTLEINKSKEREELITGVDVEQAKANLYQTESTIPQLLETGRQTQNRLSVLLGIPPSDLSELVGEGVIPAIPESVVVGIPADLLRRRPDIRAAERRLAAKSEKIGIAKADLYPTFSLTGSLGLSAGQFSDVFQTTSGVGSLSPSFRWNILNYGRLKSLVRVQEEALLEEVTNYQSTVLRAQQEVEDAMAQFLYASRQHAALQKAADAAAEAVRIVDLQQVAGGVEYNQVFTLQATLVSLQSDLVQAEQRVAQGLVEINRALGGGWEIRCDDCIPDVRYTCDPSCQPGKPQPTLCRPDCRCPKCRLHRK